MRARRLRTRLAANLKKGVDTVAGRLAVLSLRAIRRTDPDRMANASAAFLKRVGPLFPEHRTGRANLVAAFPQKTPDEIEAILSGVWDNLGRVAAEYAHLDRLWDLDLEHGTPAAPLTDVHSQRSSRGRRLPSSLFTAGGFRHPVADGSFALSMTSAAHALCQQEW